MRLPTTGARYSRVASKECRLSLVRRGRPTTQSGTAWRVTVAAASLLIMHMLQTADAQQGDPPVRAAELAESQAARNLYSPVMRTGVEGVSWVRVVYGPAEYVLLGAPALALSLAEGGPLGLGKKVSFDIVTEIIRESLEHPEKASRKVARSAYDLGLKAYRNNYRLYGKVRKGEAFSAQEAREFLVNWHLWRYMEAAKTLYNATTSYEGKDLLRRPDKVLLQQLEATAVAQAREAFGARAVVEVSVLLKAAKLEFAVFDSLVRASIGLGAYPPYQEFVRNVRGTNQALARELGSAARVPSETGPSKDKGVTAGDDAKRSHPQPSQVAASDPELSARKYGDADAATPYLVTFTRTRSDRSVGNLTNVKIIAPDGSYTNSLQTGDRAIPLFFIKSIEFKPPAPMFQFDIVLRDAPTIFSITVTKGQYLVGHDARGRVEKLRVSGVSFPGLVEFRWSDDVKRLFEAYTRQNPKELGWRVK